MTRKTAKSLSSGKCIDLCERSCVHVDLHRIQQNPAEACLWQGHLVLVAVGSSLRRHNLGSVFFQFGWKCCSTHRQCGLSIEPKAFWPCGTAAFLTFQGFTGSNNSNHQTSRGVPKTKLGRCFTRAPSPGTLKVPFPKAR